MNQGYNSSTTRQREGLEKEAWRRSEDILNFLTYGQFIAFQGEKMQNPLVISQGLELMLQVIGPLIVETVTTKDIVTGKERKEKQKGKETQKFKDYYAALAEARFLINYSINNRVNNRNEILGRSYTILNELKVNLLQDVSDLGLDLKIKADPYSAYKAQ